MAPDPYSLDYAGDAGSVTDASFRSEMPLRPYQLEAKKAIQDQWNRGVRSTLLVLPTGTGKTILFSSIIEDAVRNGGRALVLAHREELLQQAADKLSRSTGLGCGLEKAESTAHDEWTNVVVGSVQTMVKEARRERHDFSHIVVDEAHHAISPSYRAVLDHFPDAKILGVTATADRGDKRNLGEVFETLAYEYSLVRAIREGFLCQIKALTIPLKIDLTGVKQTAGDFQAAGLGTALDPYLEQIADHLVRETANRKTVVFLPLIATSKKFMGMLAARGVDTREVNGDSTDRAETLKWFRGAGRGAVLCNAMLLTEGYDQSDIDCVCVLRPTKVRSLFAQMLGRGTRIHPGKENLLILDFLWHSERHALVRPAQIVAKNEQVAQRAAEIVAEESVMGEVDLLDATDQAEGKATEERENALKKALDEQRRRKKALVDPLQYEFSIGEKDWQPDPGDLRAMGPPSTLQVAALEKAGINPDDVTCQGHASHIMDTIAKRRMEGLSTPKQIRCLERFGFSEVGRWPFDSAKKMIDRVAANMWRVPVAINPRTYQPEGIL
jgi:superfamily II DNA or RNA helicase